MNTFEKEIGIIPTKPPPRKGDTLKIIIKGLPPIKNSSISIRNVGSKDHDAFKRLRMAGLQAMKSKCWYEGPIEVSVTYYISDNKFNFIRANYIGGIMDTLGGSHGLTFTYLPIVYQDDCQPSSISQRASPSKTTYYSVEIKFL